MPVTAPANPVTDRPLPATPLGPALLAALALGLAVIGVTRLVAGLITDNPATEPNPPPATIVEQPTVTALAPTITTPFTSAPIGSHEEPVIVSGDTRLLAPAELADALGAEPMDEADVQARLAEIWAEAGIDHDPQRDQP